MVMNNNSHPDMQSPIPRRLLGSALGRSPNLDNSLTQNDDETEKQERGKRTLMEVQLSASPKNSPRPSDSFRNSFSSLGNLNSVQLAEHFRNCMKLSSENKINAKNAFELQLIDCMAMLLKRKESELDNFQVASCTLDASAKIYAYRVDCVHNEAVKMAGSLIRSNNRRKENHRNNEEDGEKDEGEIGNKPSKKERHCATVERNTKRLDSMEANSDFKIDHFFKRMASRINESQSAGCRFLGNLKILDETQEIILSSDRSCWRETGAGEERPNEVVEIPIPNFEAIKKAEVCPSFSNFSFTGWSPENDEVSVESGFEPFLLPLDQILRRNAEHAFDINAVPEPIETSDIEAEGMDVDYGEDMNTVGTVEVIGFTEKPSRRASWKVSDLKNILSLNIQEYSYFKKEMCWAGPSFWKVKPLFKNKQARDCGRRKPRTIVTLKYEESASLADFSKQTDKPICLTNATVEKWTNLKITLPEDLHLHISCLLKGFVKKKIAIPLKTKDAIHLEEVDPYNFDNANDKDNYCTNIKREDDRDVSNLTGISQENVPWNYDISQEGYDFVKVPSMVPNAFIAYSKRAKRIDMKRLEKAVFHILTHENKMVTTEPNPKETESLEVTGTVFFSKVLQELPKILRSKEAQNLSFGLAFSALLHLANNKTLLIEGTPDLSDVIVSQDKKLC